MYVMEGYYYNKFNPEYIIWCYKPDILTPGYFYGYLIDGYGDRNGHFFEQDIGKYIEDWIKFEYNPLDMGI